MLRKSAFALGLALALPCAAWAQGGREQSGAGARQAPQNTAGQTTPGAGQEGSAGVVRAEEHGTPPTLMMTDVAQTPLQGFVTHQVHEIGELSSQIDHFKAADRHDAVRVLVRMITDHVLVSDRAQNVLARRGDVSKPVSTLVHPPVVGTPDEMIRHNIQMHEQMRQQTEQLLANATDERERRIYQHALEGTQRHLRWLEALARNEPVNVAEVPIRTLNGAAVAPAAMAVAGSREMRGTNASGRRGYGQRNRGRR